MGAENSLTGQPFSLAISSEQGSTRCSEHSQVVKTDSRETVNGRLCESHADQETLVSIFPSFIANFSFLLAES